MKSQAQFNWIFVIIAGAIILTFFVSFALKYKSLQDEKLSVELLINFDNALTNLQSTTFTVFDTIEAPKEIEITCSKFRIENREYDNDKLIFSPKNLKDKIYIYYRQFNFPFKIDNFYYAISPGNKFFLVHNDQKSREYAQALIDDLPDKFKQNVLSVSSRQPNGKNVFINSNANANDVNIILQDKISIYYNNKLYNDVINELVYGAIFSDDFDCVYNKLKQNIDDVILSYPNKLILLQGSNCNYASSIQYLQNLKNLRYQDTKAVEELNKEMSSRNCPLIY